MESDNLFFDELKEVAKNFSSISEEPIKIISHHDVDGICSSSIFIKLLLAEKKNFELRLVKQPTREAIDESNLGKLLVFLDCGSGQLNLFKDIFEKTKVLILDHHYPINFTHKNLFHLNPMMEGIEEVSASVVAYLFAKEAGVVNEELIDLALVGCIGDLNDLKGYGKKVVEEAQSLGRIRVERGIKLYGRYTRPIHKVLEYSFDPFIPGISGSESNAVQFLSELGIEARKNNEWRKLSDLSLEEQRKLASAIIIERLRGKEDEAENIFGDNYTLVEKPVEIRDVREFATLVNACSRMGREDVGIRICLGDYTAIQPALTILEDYRRAIAQALDFVRGGEMMKTTKMATYIFAGDRIKDTFIAPVISILLSSNFVDRAKPIFGFVDSEGKVKISARASHGLEINLRDVVAIAAEKVGGSGGGHRLAAGALIPKGKEKDFVDFVEMELKRYGRED